jgi:hypothetical protein
LTRLRAARYLNFCYNLEEGAIASMRPSDALVMRIFQDGAKIPHEAIHLMASSEFFRSLCNAGQRRRRACRGAVGIKGRSENN